MLQSDSLARVSAVEPLLQKTMPNSPMLCKTVFPTLLFPNQILETDSSVRVSAVESLLQQTDAELTNAVKNHIPNSSIPLKNTPI